MNAKRHPAAWDALRWERDRMAAQITSFELERFIRQMTEARNAELLKERDELAAQVEVMREALNEAIGWDWLTDVESIPSSVSKQLADALSMPNTADDILRQRDARTLRNAAERVSNEFAFATYAGCINALNLLADELERKNG